MFLPKKPEVELSGTAQIQFSLLSYWGKKNLDKGINSSKALVFKIEQVIMPVFIKQGTTVPACDWAEHRQL